MQLLFVLLCMRFHLPWYFIAVAIIAWGINLGFALLIICIFHVQRKLLKKIEEYVLLTPEATTNRILRLMKVESVSVPDTEVMPEVVEREDKLKKSE